MVKKEQSTLRVMSGGLGRAARNSRTRANSQAGTRGRDRGWAMDKLRINWDRVGCWPKGMPSTAPNTPAKEDR